MTPKKHDIIELDKSQYLNYHKKAEEFYKAMLQAEKSEYWNAVGLNAVHCAISISDALLVKFRGIRSISKNHMIVVDIIKQSLNLKDINSKISTLRRILSKKSLIEYDSTVFTKSDAQDIMKQTDRLYLWAREELAK
jgi:glycine/serine hydroxymethyltransferase